MSHYILSEKEVNSLLKINSSITLKVFLYLKSKSDSQKNYLAFLGDRLDLLDQINLSFECSEKALYNALKELFELNLISLNKELIGKKALYSIFLNYPNTFLLVDNDHKSYKSEKTYHKKFESLIKEWDTKAKEYHDIIK